MRIQRHGGVDPLRQKEQLHGLDTSEDRRRSETPFEYRQAADKTDGHIEIVTGLQRRAEDRRSSARSERLAPARTPRALLRSLVVQFSTTDRITPTP